MQKSLLRGAASALAFADVPAQEKGPTSDVVSAARYATSGSRLAPIAAPGHASTSSGRGDWTVKAMRTEGIAKELSVTPGRTVVDQTGLTGEFGYTLAGLLLIAMAAAQTGSFDAASIRRQPSGRIRQHRPDRLLRRRARWRPRRSNRNSDSAGSRAKARSRCPS